MDSTGDTVTVGGAERQGKSNPFESDYISLVFQILLLTLNDDDDVTKQCMCSCHLSILLSQIDL